MGRHTALAGLLIAALAYAAVAALPWHPDPRVRLGAALAVLSLLLWVSEVVPLGIAALLIPIVATFSGLLTWEQSLEAWGNPVIFLFLASFLLVRALEKHGALEIGGALARFAAGGREARAQAAIMGISGLLSSVQNNTAVTAGLLPAVTAVARRLMFPSLALLALSYGATFGGLATPVATAPNFIGYAEMKRLGAEITFVSWLTIGIPAWLGSALAALVVMVVAMRILPPATGAGRPRDAHSARARQSAAEASAAAKPRGADVEASRAAEPDDGDADAAFAEARGGTQSDEPLSPGATRVARDLAIIAMVVTASVWLASGLIVGFTDQDHPLAIWVRRYLPESLVPTVAATLLFFVRVGPGRAVLERRDLQTLDWDTLFLIAGGLCLGRALEASGAAQALAQSVQALHLHPILLTFALGGVTVLLSELTSNTATANIFIRLAAPLAPALDLSPVATVWLVSLCASLGFALPVSTPPNAIVYGTRLVPLRHMIGVGIVVDILTLTWIVVCIRVLA